MAPEMFVSAKPKLPILQPSKRKGLIDLQTHQTRRGTTEDKVKRRGDPCNHIT